MTLSREHIIFNKQRKTVQYDFLSDFRNLNRETKCTTFPMPKIQEILLNLEGFKYAT